MAKIHRRRGRLGLGGLVCLLILTALSVLILIPIVFTFL